MSSVSFVSRNGTQILDYRRTVCVEIVQTPDGYLWVATRNGVARFDGVRFTVFDKSNTREMTSNRFVAMAKGAGGDFWLVSEDGNVIRYHDKHFGRLTFSNGIRPDSVESVTSDDDGSIWIVSDEALYRWNQRTDCFDRQKLAEDGVRFRSPWWIGTSIWALHNNELLYLLHGAIHHSALPPWLVRKGIATAAVEKDGTIWVALKNGEVSAARMEGIRNRAGKSRFLFRTRISKAGCFAFMA